MYTTILYNCNIYHNNIYIFFGVGFLVNSMIQFKMKKPNEWAVMEIEWLILQLQILSNFVVELKQIFVTYIKLLHLVTKNNV